MIAFLAMLLLAVVGARIGLSRYQPLVGGGSGTFSVEPAKLQTASFSANGYRDGSFNEVEVRLVKGTTYRIGFPLWNNGPFPVTITGLTKEYAGPSGDTVHIQLAGTTPMTASPQGRLATPFAPFTLAPGEGIGLFVNVRIDASGQDRGSALGINTVGLEYTVMRFVHRETTVFLGMAVDFCKPRCGSNS